MSLIFNLFKSRHLVIASSDGFESIFLTSIVLTRMRRLLGGRAPLHVFCFLFAIVLLSTVQTDSSWPTIPNIVECYMLRPLAHPVVCCCMWLRVVTLLGLLRKLLNQQLPTFLLFRHPRHMVSKVLWVVSVLRCTAGPTIVGSCCISLHTTANTDATTPNIVGSCYVRLHVALSSKTIRTAKET